MHYANLVSYLYMKTAVVTGASYGIGRSIADMLLGNGWKVYGVSRSKPDINNEGFVWVQCDLSDREQVHEVTAKILEGKIDAFVSNAGIVALENASDVTVGSYDRTFSVNLLAPMLLVHELKDKIQDAVIISVSSISDRIPEAEYALYCASKAANTSYFNALAQELVSARVYTLLPDYVDTPMLRTSMDGETSFDWSTTIQPQDIANLCGRLISDEAKVESGANIIVITDALKDDLKNREKLYVFNSSSKELTKA